MKFLIYYLLMLFSLSDCAPEMNPLQNQIKDETKTAWEEQYHEMLKTYFTDLKKFCKTPSGDYLSVADVKTIEKDDEMPTFFFAKTMKYLYLGFGGAPEYGMVEVVFSTEVHPFVKSRFNEKIVRQNLGL